MLPSPTDRFRQIAVHRLHDFQHTTVDNAPELRRAAVALCVVADEDTSAVIVIKRAFRGRNAGQWALPGGGLEPGETPEQAARRELWEEVGLTTTRADVIGRLDDFPAASGFAITPVVVVPETVGPLLPNPAEVHSVHLVPLNRLSADDVPYWLPQPAGPPLLQMRITPDMVIHAPTGAILWQFRAAILLGHPDDQTRVADARQPGWTRR